MKTANTIEQTHQPKKDGQASRRILYETILVLVFTFLAQFLWKDFRFIIALVPTVYLVAEKYIRRRTWGELGFKLRAIPMDLKANWHFILIVSVIVQFLVVWVAKTWLPAYRDHVIERFPLTIGTVVSYLPLLLIGAFWEEINYRALFQERLSWYMRGPIAIGIVSVFFGIGHWAQGDPMIVAIDILLVIVDSIFYGIVFERSKNVYISWIAHFLANFLAINFFLLL